MKLFDDKERTDINFANHLHNTYDYYDRSNLMGIVRRRDILNSWFEHYPLSEKKALRSRFKKTFSSAFFELFIHELFQKQGFDLQPHPTISGTSKKPDFLASGKGVRFYLEAKEVTDKTKAELALERKTNLFYDILNTTTSPNFFFDIDELLFKTKEQPSGKKVVKFIESQLPKYNPDEISRKLEKYGIEANEPIYYEDEKVKLVVYLIPKSPEFRGQANIRPIGMYDTHTFWGGVEDSIKRGIEKKAKKYGRLDKPYLICLNSTSDKGTQDFDVMNSLFGSLKISYSTKSGIKDEKWGRALDGIFFGPNGPNFTRISAIFITQVNSSNFHVSDYWFIKHPFALKELDMNHFDFSKIFFEDNQIKTKSGKSIKEILKIKEDLSLNFPL